MAIHLGSEAPNFTQESTEGTINFHDWAGGKWVVLFSHPKDFTPVCTTELGVVAKLKSEFEKRNAKAIAVSVDDVASHNGWTKDIDIVGIGYRAELKGKNMVVFTLGYSHPIEFPLPTGISVEIDPKQTHLTVSGIDRQKVGQVAADMRSLRKPDPYKNKGVRYTGEKLKKKVGKTGAK